MENKFYKTNLEDIKGRKINIGSRVKIGDEIMGTIGKVIYDEDEKGFYIRVVNGKEVLLSKLDKGFIKKYKVEVLK